MSDFLLSLLKGLYPQFFVFAVLGVVLRIRRGEWTRFDTLLFGMYLLFFLSLAFQPWLFYGILVTSRRYLLVALPLSLPFTALGVRETWRFLCRTPRGKKLGILLLAACATSVADKAFIINACIYYHIFSIRSTKLSCNFEKIFSAKTN